MNYKNTHNPILPLEHHIPDGEAHVMPDGKLYIYGSYDESSDYYCSGEYHVASTADLKNWTVHEISLNAKDISWFDDPDAPRYPGVNWLDPTPYMRKCIEEWKFKSAEEMTKRFEEMHLPPLLYAPDCNS